MIDKELEKKIRQTKEFMQLWMKFHELFKSALKSDSISQQEEDDFLETKSKIARRYEALKNSIGPDSHYDDRTFDVISQVLSLKSVVSVSDISLGKIESDWHNSYILLNRLLGDLESQKEDIRRVNPITALIRRLSGNPMINLILLIVIIVSCYYAYTTFLTAQRGVAGPGVIEFQGK